MRLYKWLRSIALPAGDRSSLVSFARLSFGQAEILSEPKAWNDFLFVSPESGRKLMPGLSHNSELDLSEVRNPKTDSGAELWGLRAIYASLNTAHKRAKRQQ